jgi:hypothetical protein
LQKASDIRFQSPADWKYVAVDDVEAKPGKDKEKPADTG